jgi:hypothetical protein
MLNFILANLAKLSRLWLVFFCLFVYAPVQTHVVVLAQSSEVDKDGDKDDGKDDDDSDDDSGGDDNSGHGGGDSGGSDDSNDDSDNDNSGSGSDNSGGSGDGDDNSGSGNSGGGSDNDDSDDNDSDNNSGNDGNSGNGNNGNSGNGNSGNGGNGNNGSDDDNDNDSNQGHNGNGGNSGSGNNNGNNDDKKDDELEDEIQEDDSGKDDLGENDRDDRLYYVGTVSASDGSSLLMDGAKLQSTSPWVEVLGTGMWFEAYGYWQGEDTFVADEVNVLAGDDWAYVQAPEILLGKSSGDRQIEAWTRGETIDTQRAASVNVTKDSVRVVAYFDGTKVRAVPKALTPPTSGLSAGWIEFTGRFDGDGIIWEGSRPFP